MPEVFFLEDISGDDINPYEAIKLASMEARRLNQARMMNDVTEDQEKVTTLALSRLEARKIRLVYGKRSQASEGAHGAAGRETGASGR